MQVSLNKQSEVPLQEQLAEQLVFLITTGGLRAGEQLPSVRSFARRLGIHHNTVSKSYQELVTRGWLRRKRGCRLCVESDRPSRVSRNADLDELINQTIRRALEMGYSLQSLRSQVIERLRVQPPDHILVVEDEAELSQIVSEEIIAKIGDRVRTCTPADLARSPELAIGSQVVAADRHPSSINLLLSPKFPCISLVFASADPLLDSVRALKKPSVIIVTSISKSFLKIARSLLAPVVGRRHVMRVSLLSSKLRISLEGIDLVFCDAVTLPLVRSRPQNSASSACEPMSR